MKKALIIIGILAIISGSIVGIAAYQNALKHPKPEKVVEYMFQNINNTSDLLNLIFDTRERNRYLSFMPGADESWKINARHMGVSEKYGDAVLSVIKLPETVQNLSALSDDELDDIIANYKWVMETLEQAVYTFFYDGVVKEDAHDYEQKDEVKRLIKQKVDYLDNSELETAYSMICEESEDRLKKQRDAANALMELGLLGLFL